LEEEVREQLGIAINGEKGYEIVTITEGTGNGWVFTSDVLKESLALWDGVECFVDHDLNARSVRDIAGVIRDPQWDENEKAIKARLKPMGPSAGLLREVGKELVEGGENARIGFSADLIFSGKNKKVDRIVKVNSVDLVYNPARGGKFVRQLEAMLNSNEFSTTGAVGNRSSVEGSEMKGEEKMEEEKMQETKTTDEKDEEVLNSHEFSTRDVAGSHYRSEKVNQELSQARELRNQMSQWTLEMGLERSKLPKAMQEMIKKQFSKKDFSVEELDEAIETQRQVLSELTANETVHSAGRVEGMLNEEDRIRLAVEDLFGVERETGKNVKVPALTGIRELYLMLTGDVDLHGGYYPERVQLATTADFTGLVKNALNKIVVKTWEQLGRAGYDWWKDISTVEHFNSLHSITGTLIGTVSDLPAISEGGEYTELVVGDSPETASFTKYGGYIPMTLELIDRDDAKKLGAYARNLASAGLRKISKLVAAIFTANSGVGPTMADTGALFNATAVTTAGGHANLLTTALSANQWDVVSQAIFNQPMLIKNEAGSYGIGPALAINPKFMLIPRALGKTAWEICAGSYVREENYMYDNVLKGTAVPIVVPEWTDANNWAAACEPAIAPAIYIGERFGIMPEIFVANDNTSPAVFMNDEHRMKVRHFLAVWVNDFRPLHKSNVA